MNNFRVLNIACDAILSCVAILYLLFAYISGAYELPYIPTCPLFLITSMHCPLCGMTRSFAELLHGNIGTALTYHLLSIPLLFSWICLTAIFTFNLGKDIRQSFIMGKITTRVKASIKGRGKNRLAP